MEKFTCLTSQHKETKVTDAKEKTDTAKSTEYLTARNTETTLPRYLTVVIEHTRTLTHAQKHVKIMYFC
jgi:hypothetical protein